ncbi:hypothetical protein BJX65DRAFT_266418 [Aspergillus insuetus]
MWRFPCFSVSPPFPFLAFARFLSYVDMNVYYTGYLLSVYTMLLRWFNGDGRENLKESYLKKKERNRLSRRR